MRMAVYGIMRLYTYLLYAVHFIITKPDDETIILCGFCHFSFSEAIYLAFFLFNQQNIMAIAVEVLKRSIK